MKAFASFQHICLLCPGKQDQSALPSLEAEPPGAVDNDATDADEDDELQPSKIAPANDSQLKKSIGPTEGTTTVVNVPMPFKVHSHDMYVFPTTVANP